MLRRRTVALAIALSFIIGGTFVFAEKEDITVKGSYVWARQDKDIPGDIEAVFTPDGKNQWNVVWSFEWEGEMRHWAGKATGSLKSGELEGEATEERDRKRTFVFKGSVEDGVFNGEHGAMREGKMNVLGTITFKSAG